MKKIIKSFLNWLGEQFDCGGKQAGQKVIDRWFEEIKSKK